MRRVLEPLFIYSDDIYCLKVETGCMGSCSYCAIRFAKGRTMSKSFSQVQEELNRGVGKGFRKFAVVGDEITSYGQDVQNGPTVLDVIDHLVHHAGVDTVYLESFEPSFMISHFDGVKSALASGKIPVFCSSVQSGSDRILTLMKRRYTADAYKHCMAEIRSRFPWVFLRNEIIVGFPGESEEDFLSSLHLVGELNVDFLHVYEYEDRPGTLASAMSAKVPAQVKKARRKRLLRRYAWNVLFKSR